MIPLKKEGVMSIISAFKPEKHGQVIKAPGTMHGSQEEVSEDDAPMASVKASMSALIKAIKSGDVDAAVEAFMSLREDCEGGETEDTESVDE